MTRSDLSELTVMKLRTMAGEAGIVGASRMVKAALVAAIGDALGLAPEPSPAAEQAAWDGLTVRQLRREALDRGVVGAARMNKATLVELLSATIRETDSSEAPSVPAEVMVPAPREVSYGFPETYGIDRVVLLVRDPEWLYCYWDVSGESWARLIQRGITNPCHGWRRVLRIFDVTDPARGELPLGDIELDDLAREWYFEAPVEERAILVEFAYRSEAGEYLCIARSNLVQVPRSRPSDNLDVRFARLYDESLRLSLGVDPEDSEPLDLSFPGSRGPEEVSERLGRLLESNVSSAIFSGQPVAVAVPD